jgi:hypothetical protein
MANKKLCLKDYLTCADDKLLSKTRKKINKKSHKGRYYGGEHGYQPSSLGSDTGGVSEAASGMGGGMNNGVIPGAFTPNVISRVPDGSTQGKADMKKQNRRNAPRKRSFADYLTYRNRAEEEETTFDDEWSAAFDDDEPINDFDNFERNRERDDEVEDFMSARYPEEEEDFRDDEEFADFDDGLDDEEDDEFDDGLDDEFDDDLGDEFDDEDQFDDLDPEEELDFDAERDEFEDGIDTDEIEDIARVTGRFVDFYRDGDEDDVDEFEGDEYEEEQEAAPGPGGFEPGQAVGADTNIASGSASTPKIDRARILFQQLVNMPGMSRGDMIEKFITDLGVTESTAVSYYERLAKEAGLTGQDDADAAMMGQGGMGDDMPDTMGAGDEEFGQEIPQEEIDQQPPNRQGIIRQVDNAHLVYKKQMEDGGFEELWVYNIGDKLDDALKTRRAILSGTDIPRGHTRSEDGQQSYTLSTMGNAQLLHITGLSN